MAQPCLWPSPLQDQQAFAGILRHLPIIVLSLFHALRVAGWTDSSLSRFCLNCNLCACPALCAKGNQLQLLGSSKPKHICCAFCVLMATKIWEISFMLGLLCARKSRPHFGGILVRRRGTRSDIGAEMIFLPTVREASSVSMSSQPWRIFMKPQAYVKNQDKQAWSSQR